MINASTLRNIAELSKELKVSKQLVNYYLKSRDDIPNEIILGGMRFYNRKEFISWWDNK
jgi:Zn-dependent peptidase ImmA (M78 family)